MVNHWLVVLPANQNPSFKIISINMDINTLRPGDVYMNWVIISSDDGPSPVRPLSEPMLVDFQLYHWEQTSPRFEWKIKFAIINMRLKMSSTNCWSVCAGLQYAHLITPRHHHPPRSPANSPPPPPPKFIYFHSRKSVWKCRLWHDGNFASSSMCF